MKTNRRKFLSTVGGAGLISPLASLAAGGAEPGGRGHTADVEARHAKLRDILRQPVLKRELFSSPGAHHEFKGLGTHVPFECKTSPLKVAGGRLKVPAGPGSGVEIVRSSSGNIAR